MKYTGGRSVFDPDTQKWISVPRRYSDFYCSITEWSKLGRGKPNFMYQVRSAIVDNWGPEDDCKIRLDNGLWVNKLSFKRWGRDDVNETEKYDSWIIQRVIKMITHRDAEVEFFSYKGNIDHVEISFPGCEMPNIIVLVGQWAGGSTNETLIFCIDAIYKVLSIKTTDYYDRYHLSKKFNQDYDYIYYTGKGKAGWGNYYEDTEWRDNWMFEDIIRKKSERYYYDHVSIGYGKH